MKIISLTQGKFAMVDDEDFDWLSQYKWHYATNKKKKCRYAARNYVRPDGKRSVITMHKAILKLDSDHQVDHRDGDRLNNQKSNLRPATHAQNCYNKLLEPNRNTSGFKGVAWRKHAGKWRARIKHNRTEVHLGYFDTQIEAAKAYDAAALIRFGEFARTNQSLGLCSP